ncbi:hypothetical protein WP1W18C01_02640 [Stenotrophomonas maltophilia]|nr:hypothetical protein WP1W18C01_02640 [Stenotrophomonas maltophilia]
MSLKTNPLRNAIVIALAASCTTPAFAQSAGDTPTNLDRIEITGSRIRQASVETAQPVVALSRAEIEKKGYINVADILQDVTAAGAPSLSRSSSLSSSRDFGGTYVSLRNLGPERSLVLIDGRRMGVSAGGYSDLASIPSAIVERVEVLTDGASALYGSDAIAGVVNIITRKNFDGGEASVYVGQYGEGDGQKRSYSATFGKTFDRGWFSVGAERTKEDEILGSEREFSRYPGGPRHPDDVKALNQTTQWGSVTVDGKSLTVGPGGDPSQKGNFHTPNPADGANTKTNMSLLSGLERTSVFANGGFSITDDLRIVADALYSKRESTKHLAGYPTRCPPHRRATVPVLPCPRTARSTTGARTCCSRTAPKKCRVRPRTTWTPSAPASAWKAALKPVRVTGTGTSATCTTAMKASASVPAACTNRTSTWRSAHPSWMAPWHAAAARVQ